MRHLQALLPPWLPGAPPHTDAQKDQEQLLVSQQAEQKIIESFPVPHHQMSERPVPSLMLTSFWMKICINDSIQNHRLCLLQAVLGVRPGQQR